MDNQTSLYMSSQWKSGSGSLFSSLNPATGEVVWKGREASRADVDEAIKSAQQAFSPWALLAVEERAHFLSRFSDELRTSRHSLSETISKETGKPLWDALNEVEAMINKISISIEAYKARCDTHTRTLHQGRLTTRHRPHGVVAVLGPYNFPAHLPNGHIIPALLAGNTVVFKPSEFTPLAAEETLRLWEKVNLPSGVLNLVQGGRETGKALIEHSDLAGVFFTGSCATGLYLSNLFGGQPSKILALEMGGNNPLVVGKITDPKAAAYTVLQSAFLSSGQRCTCARRLILPQGEMGNNVLEELVKMTKALSIGPYTQKPEPFMGPVISKKHAEKMVETQSRLLAMKGRIVVEMRHQQERTGFLTPGIMDVTQIKALPDEEYFGPFLQVIRVKDLNEAIAVANQTQFGLAAGLLSDEEVEYKIFFNKIQAGVINWNVPLTGASSSAPFGGVKQSGNHRPSAYYAADYCAYPVASIEKTKLSMPEVLAPGIKI